MPHYAIAGQPYIDIEKLKTGDAENFQRLYQLFFKDLVRKAASLLDEKGKAGSMVNHCFIKCWLRSEELTSMDYIWAFLTITLRNNCIACNSSNGSHSVPFNHILEVILSDATRNGLTRKALISTINKLPAVELIKARAIFKCCCDRSIGLLKLRKKRARSFSSRKDLNTAFQVLHVILSVENI